MKKTLIVAAVSALAAGSALAQSSVTIYGRLNVTAEATESNGVKLKQLINNASRLGFKGVEDLGGGLKAGFVIEHRFSVDTGLSTSSAFWAGQSEVYLGGGFGTVRLGRFTSEAYYATADYVGLHNHDTGTSSDALYAYLGRDTNKIAYRTPEFIKGLTAEAAVSAAEGPTIRTWDGAVNYSIGALSLGLGYEKAGDSNQVAVRALYDGGSFLVGGYVQRHDDQNLGDRMIYRLSGAFIAGPSEFHVSVGFADEYSRLSGSDATQWTLAYNYNLSKRTKVYAFYTEVDDSKKISGMGGDFSSIAVGLRHNF